MEKVEVAALFASVARFMQGEIQKNKLALIIEPIPQEITIQADAKQIEQVLINLITNSLQAMEGIQNPVIELSASKIEKKVLLEVRDNGRGIEADKLDKIFIPFYSTKAEGSGIGLPVSKQIMRLHGGNIKVWSQKGQQTTFQLYFPPN
jgi:signal transduction histidine kinase